jgi:hypothetical protein
MVVCMYNHCGVDIILPLCPREGKLSSDMVSAILIQVKNVRNYGSKISKVLFDAMSPAKVGLFNKGSSLWPIIQMVFALATDQPCTK